MNFFRAFDEKSALHALKDYASISFRKASIVFEFSPAHKNQAPADIDVELMGEVGATNLKEIKSLLSADFVLPPTNLNILESNILLYGK